MSAASVAEKQPLFESVFEAGSDVTPAPLAQTLEGLCVFLDRFMAFSSDAQAVAIALWIAHTWLIDAFDYTPYLHIQSPEKRCGKSLLLSCISLLVAKPWQVVSPSEAVLFRKIEADCPTLLLDEVDTIFSGRKDEGKEPLRALLNAGFERRAKIPRCVGPNFDLKEFAVFCPKALAGIGKLPDTVGDRCVPIRLVRRAPNEQVERFRRRDAEEVASALREALQAWGESEVTETNLRNARPDMPDQLGDRQTDICEPLLAIADYAGCDWPERSRRALTALCTVDADEDDSLGVKLLRTLQGIFDSHEKLPTHEILDALVATDDDGPWASWWEKDLRDGNVRGPAARLAKLLRGFKIEARGIRLADGTTPRGYLAQDFEDAWKRYCPQNSAKDATMQHE